MSLNFWVGQTPPDDMVFGNEWELLDPTINNELLASYGAHKRMMFVDNPKAWYLDSHKLEFPQFVAALPAHQFLDFVAVHFKQLARVANCRLLVRKERTDLELFDCAYDVGSDPQHGGTSFLRIKLPEDASLEGVAALDLIDLDNDQRLGSTDPQHSSATLHLLDGDGRELPVSADAAKNAPSFESHSSLFVSYPTELHLERATFPALRFVDRYGRRLLALPVAVETCLPKVRPGKIH
jgi:hypothetical protein